MYQLKPSTYSNTSRLLCNKLKNVYELITSCELHSVEHETTEMYFGHISVKDTQLLIQVQVCSLRGGAEEVPVNINQ